MRLRLLLLVLVVVARGRDRRRPGAHRRPARPGANVALPCEAVSTPGLVPRAAKNIAHVANVCGFVGTDIEFQSRKAADGTVHDYAFVGSMGAGTRIFDVTDPAHPSAAGRYTDPGYQNDLQVAGDTLVLGFDSLSPSGATSVCLRTKGSRDGRPDEGGRRHRPADLRPRDGDVRDEARRLLPVERLLGRRTHDDRSTRAATT